jgi:hypothetical protein
MKSRVNDLDRLQTLIRAGIQHHGSEAALARALNATQANVQRWRQTGVCPLDAQILMAEWAGLDPREVIALALIEQTKDTPRGAKVAAVLGKMALLVGVAASWLLPTPDAHAMTRSLDTMRRKVKYS